MNRVEELFGQCPTPSAFARAYLDYLRELLARVDQDEIAVVINELLAARDRGARIYFIGNGGSAATSSHFANDIAIGTRTWERPFQAMSLTDNVAVMTAIANDHGYEQIFRMQLQTVLKAGDVVVAISASGNSPNIITAIDYANRTGAVTIGLTGFDGGELRRRARYAVHVDTARGEYGPVEDLHMVLDHVIGAYLQAVCRVAGARGQAVR